MLICRSDFEKKRATARCRLSIPFSALPSQCRLTMRTDKRHALTAPADEMRQQFQGRIVCGRCGNSDWTKFTYMLPMDGRVLVKCSHCGLTFFEAMEQARVIPFRNNSIRAFPVHLDLEKFAPAYDYTGLERPAKTVIVSMASGCLSIT